MRAVGEAGWLRGRKPRWRTRARERGGAMGAERREELIAPPWIRMQSSDISIKKPAVDGRKDCYICTS